MIDTLIIHQPSDPYSDCDFRNTEDQPKVFDNPCPTCGLSLDYEGKIRDMCHCNDEDEEPILDNSCPKCHHEYDEIDYEYQICHLCHYQNKIL